MNLLNEKIKLFGSTTRPLLRNRSVDELHGNQQSDYAPRSGPEVKNGRSGAENSAPERLGCGTVKEEMSQILPRVRRLCMKNSPSFLSCIGKRTKEGCDCGSEVADKMGEGPVPGNRKNLIFQCFHISFILI